tara:strand:+ start:53784 stop:54401 length:618 start_codon:yes stop_codon:yes gene_type:complete
MATNEFRQIRLEAGDVDRSDRWYINAVREFAKGVDNPMSVFSSDLGKFETSVDTGNMMMFTYDAKHAETLPYYDKFPLSIIIEPLPNIGGFSGINLHYLPPLFRAEVLGALRETTEKLTDEKAQLRSSWEVVKRFSQYPQIKGAVKKYIFGQVTSRFYKVNPIHWRSAVFLPTQQFTGATDRTVYRRTMLKEERKKKPSMGMGSV